jgi:phage baseplate assembly protein V
MAARDDQPAEFEEMLRYATVVSVDHGSGRVVVSSGDVETDDIDWLERRMGKTRTWSPPSEGEQMLLLCPSGELAGGIVLGGVRQNERPHVGNSLRELIEFDDGAVLAYDPEAHKLDVLLPDGATIEIKSTGGVSIDASSGGVSIKGDVSIEGKLEATGDVVGADVSLKNHVHTGVAAGAALSGKPQ